ncbi:MAG TPA: DUF748 domain-containing protein, partial [Puia sp.]|nr:DUF748 domain-containing protein [Puia sp.]
AFVSALIILFVAPLFIDPIIRSSVERDMNEQLKGYETHVAGAHLRLFDGELSLQDVTLIQKAHPRSPVGRFPVMSIDIQWSELFIGHIVADLLLFHPRLRIDLTQLRTEEHDKVPLSKKGWQDAIESIYPFRVNHLTIDDADVTYVDTDPKRPLRLEHLYVSAGNIRNLRTPDASYPSPITAEAAVFDVGHASIKGNANFLTKPVASFAVNYHIENVPLQQFRPELQRENLEVEGGTLTSDGFVAYGTAAKRVDVREVRIAGARFGYVHSSPTAAVEARRVAEVKEGTKKINNAPATFIKISRLDIVDSEASFTDETKDPHYRLFISQLRVELTNLSNHFSEGLAHLRLSGLFMGSGLTTLRADFRPEKAGSDFDMDLAMHDASLPSMNDLLRAYGKFDVETGQLSVYSQVTVRQGEMKGYVKPLFSKLKVYDPAQDKNKTAIHKVYEMAVGAAAKVVKNSSTNKVATQVDMSGRLKNPDVSAWQAMVEFVENGFVRAILPGFDRQVRESASG